MEFEKCFTEFKDRELKGREVNIKKEIDDMDKFEEIKKTMPINLGMTS